MAVLLGTILSLVAYLYRTSRPAVRSLVPDADDPAAASHRWTNCADPNRNVRS
jgi:hypothetical protein